MVSIFRRVGLGPLPTHSKSTRFTSMRKLTAILCLTLAVLLGSEGVSASADFQKGLTAYKSGDYATALRDHWCASQIEHNG